MTSDTQFDLKDFLPYMLNRAAEASSIGFQPFYKEKYGMLRTEWRVLFHLGRYGNLTAKQICDYAGIHKTKVSRAVHALEQKRFLTRERKNTDRRQEVLALTPRGTQVFNDLCNAAQEFDREMVRQLSAEDQATLRRCLTQIANLT